jgi:hypothetical protein
MSSNNPIQSIRVGRIQRPQKAVIYGPEGIGKSSLAAQFPNPVFLDTEGGTHHLDCARLPAPESWEHVTQAVTALATLPHEFDTLVIDTADWLEKLLIEEVCRRENKSNIEQFGYGKGYVVLAEEAAKFLASLDRLLKRGMHVVVLAHCRIVKFEQPDAAGAYDRYELKVSKQVAPLFKEWCDMLLFANWFTKVAENDNGTKRGVGGRERVLYTTHTAAWDAKNRHSFEEKVKFAFESIASAFQSGKAAQTQNPEPQPATAGDPLDQLGALIDSNESAVNAFLLARQQIKPGQTWQNLAPDYIARVLSAPERFLKAVSDFNTVGGAQ